MYLIQLLTEH